MKPSAKIVLDSINEWGQRLTTMEVVMHRFILAEFNTHRDFSRNSASSRAIPYQKIRNRVVDGLAYPVTWPSEQKGMQGGESLDLVNEGICHSMWAEASGAAIRAADICHEMGLHKSLINRLLEPYMWHTAIVSATEWDNFFYQRCHADAQPEMKALADAMQLAYYQSTPKQIGYGGWHMPYVSQTDMDEILKDNPSFPWQEHQAIAKKVSTARCARVSYLTHDGNRDYHKDVEMFNDKLLANGHWSPFEHVATPINPDAMVDCGNFRGWGQFRKEFRFERRVNFIPNLPELAHIAMKMEAGVK